jgi:hypothetical protein
MKCLNSIQTFDFHQSEAACKVSSIGPAPIIPEPSWSGHRRFGRPNSDRPTPRSDRNTNSEVRLSL